MSKLPLPDFFEWCKHNAAKKGGASKGVRELIQLAFEVGRESRHTYGQQCREQALEEAARVCCQTDADGDGPDSWGWHSKDYAAAIRALKETK